ncbi:hypothetical protein J4218_02820 [Candidatus Pacearchaeota archaeon]|nr:hypothetical protein [Candidatus Pacearchaeota archaeon]
MKKTMLESLLGVFGVERTETFFQEFQETREAMKRLANNKLHQYDGTSRDRLVHALIKAHAIMVFDVFYVRKSEITLLTSNRRWCYVPPSLKSVMDVTREQDKFYSQFYVGVLRA